MNLFLGLLLIVGLIGTFMLLNVLKDWLAERSIHHAWVWALYVVVAGVVFAFGQTLQQGPNVIHPPPLPPMRSCMYTGTC